jgi:VanZ family protein
VVLYMAAIFIASAMPSPTGPPGLMPDKVLHALAYAGLAVLLVRAMAGGLAGPVTWPIAVWAVVIAGAYGITDEIHQAFVPTRDPNAFDLLADVIGASAAALVLRVRASAARHEPPPAGVGGAGRGAI